MQKFKISTQPRHHKSSTIKVVSRYTLGFVLLLTGFSTSSFAATSLFKCTQSNGIEVYSDQPCSIDYTNISLSSAGVVESQKAQEKKRYERFNKTIPKKLIIGQWERKGFIYSLNQDGSLRAEKLIDGELVAWGSGTWVLTHSKLSMHFSKYSSGANQYTDIQESFMTGVIKWGENNETFSIRSNGALKYFKKMSGHDAILEPGIASISK